MIKEIVSKIENNNYEKVNTQQRRVLEKPETAYADTKNVSVGVNNSNEKVRMFCMVDLVNGVKIN